MNWKIQSVVFIIEIFFGFITGRFMQPIFRKIKTGKFDIYIGDRFKKDGSEPRFGGFIILAVFLVGISSAMVSVGFSHEISAICIFAVMMTFLGGYDDYIKDVIGGLGMKNFYKYGIIYILCFMFLIYLKIYGLIKTTVLLPFRLGYMEFGKLYIPLMAAFMTFVISAVKTHDCPDNRHEYGVDGLCGVTAMIFSIAVCSAGSFITNGNMSAVGMCLAGAVFSFLIWGISPAKIYLGESGAFCLGSIMTAFMVISGIPFAFILAGIGFFADRLFADLQRIVFKLRKKLLFKGNSLHEHLINKGYGDYKVIAVFIFLDIIGSSMMIAFAMYSQKFL